MQESGSAGAPAHWRKASIRKDQGSAPTMSKRVTWLITDSGCGMAGRLLEETNCGEMIRLRSIVASRLEPKSRREMEDAARYAYNASLVSTERSHNPLVLIGATFINLVAQRNAWYKAYTPSEAKE